MLPSIDAEPMYIAFEAVAGTVGCLGVLVLGELSLTFEIERTEEVLCSVVSLWTASGFVAGGGGGNGEMDRADIEAEWTW